MIEYVFYVRRKKKRKKKRHRKWIWILAKKHNRKSTKKKMSQNPNDINQKISLFTISQGTYANETN